MTNVQDARSRLVPDKTPSQIVATLLDESSADHARTIGTLGKSLVAFLRREAPNAYDLAEDAAQRALMILIDRRRLQGLIDPSRFDGYAERVAINELWDLTQQSFRHRKLARNDEFRRHELERVLNQHVVSWGESPEAVAGDNELVHRAFSGERDPAVVTLICMKLQGYSEAEITAATGKRHDQIQGVFRRFVARARRRVVPPSVETPPAASPPPPARTPQPTHSSRSAPQGKQR